MIAWGMRTLWTTHDRVGYAILVDKAHDRVGYAILVDKAHLVDNIYRKILYLLVEMNINMATIY